MQVFIANHSDQLLITLNINFMISVLSISIVLRYHAQVQANHRWSSKRQDPEHSVYTIAS